MIKKILRDTLPIYIPCDPDITADRRIETATISSLDKKGVFKEIFIIFMDLSNTKDKQKTKIDSIKATIKKNKLKLLLKIKTKLETKLIKKTASILA
jgi:hypothetical protein